MNAVKRELIELPEYNPRCFSTLEIPYEVGEVLWRNYGIQVSVEFPSPKTRGQWRLASQGWVGYIPLTAELGFYLSPKVSLRNLFGMIEYAYRLKSFKFFDGLVSCDSIDDFYEQLAKFLALKVLDRGRKGFYRAYLPQEGQLPHVVGRVNFRHTMRRPWDVNLDCHYEEHTSDVEENQILAWTFQHVLLTGLCSDRSRPFVHKAYRTLLGATIPRQCTSRDCIGRLYNRLNQDYQSLHVLCRFFLEHSGPSHMIGDHTMVPFLVNMPRLYELFVFEWLNSYLPSSFYLRAQEPIRIGSGRGIQFNVDIVLYDGSSNTPICVFDTKYKNQRFADPTDVEQIVAYAEMLGCREAVLIYPLELEESLDDRLGSVRLRTLTFPVEGDLDDAGRLFMNSYFDGTH